MDEAARLGVLVADDRHRLAPAADQALAAEHPVDGRGGLPDQGGDPVRTPAEALPEGDDLGLLGDGQTVRARARSRAAVDEPGLPGHLPARQPAVLEAPAHPAARQAAVTVIPASTSRKHRRPTPWRQTSVGVTMHRAALPVVELSALLKLAGDRLLVVTNPVGEQI